MVDRLIDHVKRLRLFNRAIKRVIAPYLRIVKKSERRPKVIEDERFSYYLQRKPSVLLRDLSSLLSDSVDLVSVLHETSDVLKVVTGSAGTSLYMVDQAVNEIYLSARKMVPDRFKIRWQIKEGTTVAAYVASTKQYIMVDEILGDHRFPEGIGYLTEMIKSVLCIPVVTPNGECFAVIEFFKDTYEEPFTFDDLKIGVIVTGWMSAAIHQNQQRLAIQKQQKLNDYLLDLTKCYFADTALIDKMISEIVKFARDTLGAEKGSFFILDKECDELVADLYDQGIEEVDENKRSTRVRFGKERAIAGIVARTGVTINIKNAYLDPRFNKEIDEKSGYLTRAILCMPIMGEEEILGVVQVINKNKGGCFTTLDEDLFKTFSSYCALALRYTQVHTKMQKKINLGKCYSNLFHSMVKPCIHDLQYFLNNLNTAVPDGFNSFTWHGFPEYRPKMPQTILYMLTKVIGITNLNKNHAIKFILTMRNLYMNNSYHNFDHAFCGCHCMYNILMRNGDLFTPLEQKSLILAAFCHDVDHPGFTSNFLSRLKDNLAVLYKESTLENHHFFITMEILNVNQLVEIAISNFARFLNITLPKQQTKIFNSVTSEEYAVLRDEIKDAILATDLSVFFKTKRSIKELLSNHTFAWADPEQRKLLKAIMMASVDFAGFCKPFVTAKFVSDCLIEESYNQGDIEGRYFNLISVSNFDRTQTERVPEDQVIFLNCIVIPCVEILKNLLPSTAILYENARQLRRAWQELIDMRGAKLWRKEESVVQIRSK